MEGVQTVDVSWLHHSQKGMSDFPCKRFLRTPGMAGLGDNTSDTWFRPFVSHEVWEFGDYG